jgi:site-specific recombinase XerC
VRATERAAPHDRAIVLLLVYAGLRLSELVALDLDDARVSAQCSGPCQEPQGSVH